MQDAMSGKRRTKVLRPQVIVYFQKCVM